MNRQRMVLGVLTLALGICVVVLVQEILASDGEMARVRVVHAAPGAPSVDVWVDGHPVSTGISYTTVTAYVPLAAGPHTVQLTPSGIPIPVISETVILTGGLDVTVVGLGQGLNVTVTWLVDNNSPANADAVRLMHASPDSGAVDITVTGTLTTATVSALSYKEASPYLAGLGEGAASFEIRPAGQVTPLLQFTRTLEAGTINTFFVMGLSTPPGSLQYPLRAVHSVDRRFVTVFLPIVSKQE